MALDKVILITGASSGIGAGIARELGAPAARSRSAPAAPTGWNGSPPRSAERRCPPARRHRPRRCRRLRAGGAGALRPGRRDRQQCRRHAALAPASLKVDEWDRMIDVNIRGVLHGIAAVLPEMTERGSGHIVNIASIGALAGLPTAAVYCATKHAVRAISEGLRQEHERIRVTCIHPGVVESELADTITDPVAAEAMKASGPSR
jgi:NADP-dependent 3-hydroxy acid dehydrogenase YdfG